MRILNGYLIYIDLNNMNCYFNKTVITINAKLKNFNKIINFEKLINLESQPIRSKLFNFYKTLSYSYNFENIILTNPFYFSIKMLSVIN